MGILDDPTLMQRPLSVADIIVQANTFDYDPHIPLLYLLRSANTILKEAEIYEREGNDQQAFLLLYRHAQFVINKIGTHPEVRNPKNKKEWVEANRAVKQNMAKLERMKPRIQQRYDDFQAQMTRNAARRRREKPVIGASRGSDDIQRELAGLDLNPPGRQDPALYGAKHALQAEENAELAVRIANNEIKRRDANRRAVRQAGVSEEEEQERRVAGMWGNWESELVHDSRRRGSNHEGSDDLSARILEARRRGDEAIRASRRRQVGEAPGRPTTPQINYPTVPQSSSTWNAAFAQNVTNVSAEQGGPQPSSQGPPRPEKAPLISRVPPSTRSIQSPPTIPEKIPSSDSSGPVSRSDSSTPPRNDLSSGKYTFKPSAYLENGTPLRTVFLPSALRSEFLKIASSNTQRNLETCGMLCGTLISNALFISKLVIPKQESTSDTCEMTEESELFDYCDSEDLMVLGWIHTHPSQTCFMSSRDLHTHSGFQAMMSESVAIVCAPSKKPNWGAFRLTDPPGMKSVLNCSQTGVFHPHAEENIYTDAMKPGHVCELPGLEFGVEDLRYR